MNARHSAIFVPAGRGRDALAELDRVARDNWSRAYGQGRVGPDLHQ